MVTMAQSKNQKILRYVLYGLVGAGVLGAVIFGGIVRPLQVRTQKQNFAKAEASIDALAAKIEQTIGKPDETKKTKTCDRANLKFEQGPLGCNITVSLLYKNSEQAKANQLMETLSKLNSSKLRVGSGSSRGLSFVSKDVTQGAQVFYQDAPKIENLTCVFGYRYPSGINQVDPPRNEEGFAVSISCGGPAMAEFFPETN